MSEGSPNYSNYSNNAILLQRLSLCISTVYTSQPQQVDSPFIQHFCPHLQSGIYFRRKSCPQYLYHILNSVVRDTCMPATPLLFFVCGLTITTLIPIWYTLDVRFCLLTSEYTCGVFKDSCRFLLHHHGEDWQDHCDSFIFSL